MWSKVMLKSFVWFLIVEISFGVAYLRFKRQDVANVNLPIEFFNNCSCVIYYQCDDQGFIITSGKGLFDIRTGNGEERKKRIICQGGKFQGELVCCKFKPGEENKPPVTTTPTTAPITTPTRTCKTCKIKCGKPRPAAINVRIFSGDDELTPLEGEFPWLAAIYKRDAGSTQWTPHKVGSLIHPKVILTATHVVKRFKPNELKVIVNGQIVLSQIGANVAQERNVEEIINHPQFASGTLYNDVSLLILEEAYNISTSLTINTICLQPEIPFENKRCFVAGWGKTPTQNGTSDILKKLELQAHPHDRCQEMLRKTRLGPNFLFHESFMCAGGEGGKDACTGDGGSPLVCPSGANDTMYQVGIVAYGIGCGMKDVPGVYVNVAHLHSWIIQQLKDRNINI